MTSQLRRLTQELALPLAGRLALFLGADVALLGGGLLAALLVGGEPPLLYAVMVLLPLLSLGALAMADVIALERRAGCLDLALALPESWRYFARRLVIVGGAAVTQSWLVIVALWISSSASFPLLPPLLHVLAVAAFLAAASLFWAVRLTSPGAVFGAVLACAALAGRWIGDNPVPERIAASNALVGSGADFGTTLLACGALLAGGAFLLALARRQLAHGEAML